ncbi:8561_t:CDS:1, partial [Racocetra persica]
KKKYAETIGIVQKAIKITIEKDDLNILKFLKNYILQNEHSLDKNTTKVSTFSHKTSILKEYPETNIIIENSQVSNSIKRLKKVDT